MPPKFQRCQIQKNFQYNSSQTKPSKGQITQRSASVWPPNCIISQDPVNSIVQRLYTSVITLQEGSANFFCGRSDSNILGFVNHIQSPSHILIWVFLVWVFVVVVVFNNPLKYKQFLAPRGSGPRVVCQPLP